MVTSKLLSSFAVRALLILLVTVAMVAPSIAIWCELHDYLELSLYFTGTVTGLGMVLLFCQGDTSLRTRAAQCLPLYAIYALELANVASMYTLLAYDYTGVASLQFMFSMVFFLRKMEERIYAKSITSLGS